MHVSRANGFIRDMLIIFIFTEINTKNKPSRFKGKKQIQKTPTSLPLTLQSEMTEKNMLKENTRKIFNTSVSRDKEISVSTVLFTCDFM